MVVFHSFLPRFQRVFIFLRFWFLENMEIIIDPKQPLDFQTSAGIGNFDGVHLGHKKIIDVVKRCSRENSTRSCVITFDPHPQRVLGRKEAFLILPLERRFEMFESTGY